MTYSASALGDLFRASGLTQRVHSHATTVDKGQSNITQPCLASSSHISELTWHLHGSCNIISRRAAAVGRKRGEDRRRKENILKKASVSRSRSRRSSKTLDDCAVYRRDFSMQYNNTSVSNQARTANGTLQTSLRTAMLRMRPAECGLKAVGTPAFPSRHRSLPFCFAYSRLSRKHSTGFFKLLWTYFDARI